MPCRGPDDDPHFLHIQIHQQRQAIDKLTRLLCGCCRIFTALPQELAWPRGLKTWWKDHKKLDAEREKAEAAAKKTQAAHAKRDRDQRIKDARALLKREGVGLDD